MKLFFFFCLAFVIFACKLKPEELIIGKWKSTDDFETYEFFQDGTVTKVDHGTSLSGNYQWLDSYRLKLELKVKGSINDIMIMRILISEKELVLINPRGTLIKYHKVD
jgi:hypothetical protein